MTFKIVADNLREREPLTRGRTPTNELSIKLLEGRTVFIEGHRKTFGSVYSLAKSHGKKAHTQKIDLNGVIGVLVWFE